jgi:uncharacterized membrane protein YdjX (TVP38/TMEM64 family)
LWKSALAGALVALLFVWAGSQGGVRTAVDEALAWVRAAGPFAFFGAMALVPAPLAWFTLPAGEAFAPMLGLPGVVAAALAAVAVQIAWCYAAARHVFRPKLRDWLERRGHRVPEVSRENAWAVVLLVRLVPGPPLPLQCALLGLARVPFGIYFVASWLITVPWVVGGVVLGRGALGGRVGLIVAGAGVLGAAAAAAWLARRRLGLAGRRDAA